MQNSARKKERKKERKKRKKERKKEMLHLSSYGRRRAILGRTGVLLWVIERAAVITGSNLIFSKILSYVPSRNCVTLPR